MSESRRSGGLSRISSLAEFYGHEYDGFRFGKFLDLRSALCSTPSQDIPVGGGRGSTQNTWGLVTQIPQSQPPFLFLSSTYPKSLGTVLYTPIQGSR